MGSALNTYKIIEAYRNDMSKHAPLQQVQRINMVWNSIPSQLARDNKKFIYGALKRVLVPMILR